MPDPGDEPTRNEPVDPSPHPGGRADVVRRWADAVFATTKSALLLIVGAIAVAALIVTVAQNLSGRSITVALSPQSDTLLSDLGSDYDLRASLVEELNSRVKAVQEIVHLNAIGADLTNADRNVSLELFGLALGSDDLTRMLRRITGQRLPPTVRLTLNCSPGACDTAKLLAASHGGAGQTLTLVASIDAAGRSQRLSFTLPPSNPALHRSLRMALQQIAELVLRQAEPLLASVLFLNEPLSADFLDQAVAQWNLAAGTAFAADPAHNCLAAAVYGEAVFWRGGYTAGIQRLERNLGSFRDRDCRIILETNLALMHIWASRCWVGSISSPMLDQAAAALDALNDIPGRLISAPQQRRIRGIRLLIGETREFDQLTGDQRRLDLTCLGIDPPRTAPFGKSDLKPTYGAIKALMSTLPPGGDQLIMHQVLSELVTIEEDAIAPGAVTERYALARMLNNVVDRYTETDNNPRSLFVAKGRFLYAMARIAGEADAAPAAQRTPLITTIFGNAAAGGGALDPLTFAANQNLIAAGVAFEDADATTPIAQLLENTSDLEPLIRLGDVFWASGNTVQAGLRYAAAVKRFADEDEPPHEIRWLASAAARWATLLIRTDGCKKGPLMPTEWEDAWSRLGQAKNVDVCSLSSVPRDDGDEGLGLLRAIDPLVQEAIAACAVLDQVANRAPDPFPAMRVLDCLDGKGANSLTSWNAFRNARSGAWLDEQIRRIN